jgi:hypothetical protein
MVFLKSRVVAVIFVEHNATALSVERHNNFSVLEWKLIIGEMGQAAVN